MYIKNMQLQNISNNWDNEMRWISAPMSAHLKLITRLAREQLMIGLLIAFHGWLC